MEVDGRWSSFSNRWFFRFHVDFPGCTCRKENDHQHPSISIEWSHLLLRKWNGHQPPLKSLMVLAQVIRAMCLRCMLVDTTTLTNPKLQQRFFPRNFSIIFATLSTWPWAWAWLGRQLIWAGTYLSKGSSLQQSSNTFSVFTTKSLDIINPKQNKVWLKKYFADKANEVLSPIPYWSEHVYTVAILRVACLHNDIIWAPLVLSQDDQNKYLARWQCLIGMSAVVTSLPQSFYTPWCIGNPGPRIFPRNIRSAVGKHFFAQFIWVKNTNNHLLKTTTNKN